MKSKSIGITCAIISAMIFGGMPIMTMTLYTAGATLVGIAFYRYLIIGVILFIACIALKKPLKLHQSIWLRIMICGVVGMSMTVLLLYAAYTYIPTGMVTTLHFTYPIMVSVVGVFILKKSGHYLKYTALVIAAFGIFALFDYDGRINVIGIAIALLSAATYTLYIILMDDQRIAAESSMVIAFYINLSCIFTTGIIGLFTQQISICLTFKGWALLLVTAIIIGFGGTVFFQLAVKNIGGQSASILSTFEPITSVFVGFFLLGEELTFKIVLGMVLIVISTMIVIIVESKPVND